MKRKPRQTMKNKVKITKTVRPAVLSAPVQATVKTMVKRAIHKESENKRVGSVGVDATFNSGIAGNEAYSLLPPIAVGADGNQRIGDKVRPRSLIVRGTVQWDHAFASANYCPPSTGRLLILTQKNIKVGTGGTIPGFDASHLLRDNIGTDVARQYNGGAFDNLAPINTDLFRVYMDKKVKLLPYLNTPQAATQLMAAGTTKTYSFSVRIKCPATLTYDDGNGNFANNFAPFFVFGAVCDDGTGPYTQSTPWRVRVSSILDYEDA